jgi:nucleoid DNA-binding protein
MFINIETKERLEKIERNQNVILSKLENIEKKLESNTEVILTYFGTYRDQKLFRAKEIMLSTHFNKDQRQALQSFVNVLKEVITDKENLESKFDGGTEL